MIDITSAVGALFSAVALVLVAIINKNTNRAEKNSTERAKLRAKENRLSMDMTAANSALCDVIAIAIAGGHVNGNVEAAREKAKQARDAYESFLREEMSKAISED